MADKDALGQDEEKITPVPVEDVDEDWRRAELEKLMFGDDKKPSSFGKIFGLIIAVIVLGVIGWMVFAPSSSEESAAAAATSALPADLPGLEEAAMNFEPTAPPPPPVPVPEPRPHRNLFEVQTQFDGKQYIAYTIQPEDDLTKIGEKLREVTGFPRLVTYQAVADAYWRKYFSYDQPDVAITSPKEVRKRVGELIQIPLPLEEYPSYDLASEVEKYNES